LVSAIALEVLLDLSKADHLATEQWLDILRLRVGLERWIFYLDTWCTVSDHQYHCKCAAIVISTD